MTLPKLTEKPKEIIDNIYHYRFLNRFHIQQMLSHKNRTRINKWLDYLTINNFLYRKRSTKFGENTKPAVYYININGIRYLRLYKNVDSKHLQNLYYESKRKESFETHCLSLADFICNIKTHAKSQNKAASILTKVDYSFSEDSEDDVLYTLYNLSPDAYYTFSGLGIAKACFIEIIDERMKPTELRRIIAKYIKAWKNGEEESLGREKFPVIACIMPNEKKLYTLKKQIKKIKHEYMDDELDAEVRFNLVLISDIQTTSIADSIWENV